MKIQPRLTFVAGLLVIFASASSPAYAQKKWYEKLGVRIDKGDTKSSSPSPTSEQSQRTSENDKVPTPKPERPATFTVMMSPIAACKAVNKYFVAADIEVKTSDCDAGQITTSPVFKRGWAVDSSRRNIVNFVSTEGGTEVRVKVMKTGSGFFSINGEKSQSDQKSEGVDTKSSVKLATELRNHLQSQTNQATR